MGKRFMCMLAVAFLLLPAWAFAAIPDPTLSPDANPYDAEHPELLEEDQLYGTSALLIEEHTGRVIFEKNPDQVMFPASTTKIMTVYLGIKYGNLEDMVTVSANAINLPDDATNLDLREGEEIRLIDLLYGTLLRSGNDGANAIAEYISGDIYSFAELMNRTARELGCTNTNFVNPHGLHDDNHFTTARDLAIITQAAMKDPTFRKIAGTVKYNLPKTNAQRQRSISTRHRIMIPSTSESSNRYYYEYTTGVKSGTTSMAGGCYVGSATKDGVDLISVVLYAGERTVYYDTKKLFEYGFSQFVSVSPIDLYKKNPITIETNGFSLHDANLGRLTLACVAADELGSKTEITATSAEIEALSANLRSVMNIEFTRSFTAPITAGEVMGTMTYRTEDGTSVVYNLIAERSIAERENKPKTIAQIQAETAADTSFFPPLSVELVLVFLSPLLLFVVIILILRMIFRRLRRKQARLPKNSNRYLK